MDEYDPLESISLLAPKSIDLRHIPGGFARLTQHDIAAKLAKVSPAASCLARLKFAGQWELIDDLERWVMVKCPPLKIPQPGMLRTMSHQAVIEVIDPKICRTCKGRGWMPIDAKIQPCEACDGGKYRYSEESRAKAVGVSRRQWRQVWEPLYLHVLTAAWGIESELRSGFR